jgi:hypothetical protein
VKVGTYSSNDHLLYQEVMIDLSLYPQFDYYLDDAIQTPFTANTNVYLSIVAYNEMGESEMSNLVSYSDGNRPDVTLVFNPANSWGPNNLGQQWTGSFELLLSTSEYMDLDFSYYFSESGADPYLLDTNNVTFTWDADQMGGKFSILVDGSSNGAGADTLILTGIKDNSMNLMHDNTGANEYSYNYYFILGGYVYFNFNENESSSNIYNIDIDDGNSTNNPWTLTNNAYDVYEGTYSLISTSNVAISADSIEIEIDVGDGDNQIPANTWTTIKFVSKNVTFGTGIFFVNGTSQDTLTNSGFVQTEHVYQTSSATSGTETFKWKYNTGNSAGYMVIDMIEIIW